MRYEQIKYLLGMKRIAGFLLSACQSDDEINLIIECMNDIFTGHFIIASTKTFCDALAIFSDFMGIAISERRRALK